MGSANLPGVAWVLATHVPHFGVNRERCQSCSETWPCREWNDAAEAAMVPSSDETRTPADG